MSLLSEKTISVVNDLENLSQLRKEVGDFLGSDCPKISKSRIIFCLDEVVTNIIEHGYPTLVQSSIQIQMQSFEKEWIFKITDEGIPFDPTAQKTKTWEDLFLSGAEGGFGLKTLKKVIKLKYKRLTSQNKNELTLTYIKDKNE